MQTPAAVIFDCDGVLVDSEILAIEVEITLLAQCGLVYEPADYHHRFLGLNDKAYVEALDADARALTGAPLPTDFIQRAHDQRWDACQRRLTAVTGCAEALAALALPMAVASSSGAVFLREKLRLTGLLEAFDPHIYSADLVPGPSRIPTSSCTPHRPSTSSRAAAWPSRTASTASPPPAPPA